MLMKQTARCRCHYTCNGHVCMAHRDHVPPNRASARLTASARKVKQVQDQPWHRPGDASSRQNLPRPSEQLAERAAHAAAADVLDGGDGSMV